MLYRESGNITQNLIKYFASIKKNSYMNNNSKDKRQKPTAL